MPSTLAILCAATELTAVKAKIRPLKTAAAGWGEGNEEGMVWAHSIAQGVPGCTAKTF